MYGWHISPLTSPALLSDWHASPWEINCVGELDFSVSVLFNVTALNHLGLETSDTVSPV